MAADNWAQRKIGPYQIEECIGEGVSAVVFRAFESGANRHVALKLMKSLQSGTSARARFELEAEMLGQLEHPNIARLYSSGVVNCPSSNDLGLGSGFRSGGSAHQVVVV